MRLRPSWRRSRSARPAVRRCRLRGTQGSAPWLRARPERRRGLFVRPRRSARAGRCSAMAASVKAGLTLQRRQPEIDTASTSVRPASATAESASACCRRLTPAETGQGGCPFRSSLAERGRLTCGPQGRCERGACGLFGPSLRNRHRVVDQGVAPEQATPDPGAGQLPRGRGPDIDQGLFRIGSGRRHVREQRISGPGA